MPPSSSTSQLRRDTRAAARDACPRLRDGRLAHSGSAPAAAISMGPFPVFFIRPLGPPTSHFAARVAIRLPRTCRMASGASSASRACACAREGVRKISLRANADAGARPIEHLDPSGAQRFSHAPTGVGLAIGPDRDAGSSAPNRRRVRVQRGSSREIVPRPIEKCPCRSDLCPQADHGIGCPPNGRRAVAWRRGPAGGRSVMKWCIRNPRPLRAAQF